MPSARHLVAPVALSVAVALGACGGSPERSSSRFCTRLDQELPGLEGPLATQADQDALVARYDALSEVAPLAIQQDWEALTELVHTAVTLVPTDPESVQRAADQAYATERAYRRIFDWVGATCGLTMPQPGGLESTPTTPPPADTTESTPA